ncbi:MAG TPA: extracellular solute-binding protein [Candidatus Acidoferrales bacterium]|nr:extracellular solute-binding protein [Candidatus Acidoferrales bacterium]
MTSLKILSIYCAAVTAIFIFTNRGFAAPIDDVIAGAKKEGTIEFYAPSTLTPQGAQALGAAFNKKYGLGIKLQFSPSGNMTRDIGKVVGLGASGVPPEWDLMVVTDAHHATLWVKKMHQPFDYKSVGVDPKMIQFDNGAVSFANQFVLPAYNKKLVSANDVPKSWDDLLNPKWKGKLGVSSATHHMARLAAGPWGEEKTTHFVKALTKQDLILGRLGEIYNRLLLGEIVAAVSLSDSEIKSEKNKNAPVVFAEAVSPLIAPGYDAGVPKNAAHPNVAYLMAAYLTTPEAQKIWEKYAGQSSAFIPGTAAYKYVQKKNVVYMSQDKAEMIDRLSREYGKIFGFSGL